MSKGVDRVVGKIHGAYDYALMEIEVIPYWINYQFKYEELITEKQCLMAQEGLIASGAKCTNAIINTPLDFDKIRELLKEFGFKRVTHILDNFEVLSEGKIFI